MGYEADDLLSVFDTLTEEDIWQYRYPSDQQLNSVGVRGIYLGNYVRWDPKAQHEKMIREFDYKSSSFGRTFDCYDHVDCFNFMDLHDVLKLYKHGYSKVTDHASREIRFGRLTRNEGLALVEKYEHIPPEFDNLFCEWIGIKRQSLQFLMNQHRADKYWKKLEPDQWRFEGWSNLHLETRVSQVPTIFHPNSSLSYGGNTRYITVGKGWP
jgi:hypothetical protein